MIGFGLAFPYMQPEKVKYRRVSQLHHLHDTYSSMKNRCLNPKNTAWKDYGGRGITICERWLIKKPIGQGFRNFLADMGERPAGFSIERIDNDGPYSPENCRWATRADQYANRRSNVWLTYGGETMTMKQWAAHLDIPYTTLCNRYRKKWTTEAILDTHILWGKGKTHCKNGHEFTEKNTYRHGVSRHCRTCRNDTMRDRRKKGLVR